mmetsp:Transcript_1937/g.6953  ORF Transcript_1937/g.6953 Transcript_1937/m.6953 type:complete len:207 (-) Transcript_1937:1329-1949(-)
MVRVHARRRVWLHCAVRRLHKEGVVLVEHLLCNDLEPLTPDPCSNSALAVELDVELALEDVAATDEQRRATLLHEGAAGHDDDDVLVLEVGLLPHELRAEPAEELFEREESHQLPHSPVLSVDILEDEVKGSDEQLGIEAEEGADGGHVTVDEVEEGLLKDNACLHLAAVHRAAYLLRKHVVGLEDGSNGSSRLLRQVAVSMANVL